MEPSEIESWWSGLPDFVRDELRVDPDARLSQASFDAVTNSGVGVSASWWTSVQEGPDGFRLPGNIAGWISEHEAE